MEERALPRVSLTGLKWSRSHTTAAVRRFCFSLLPCLMTRFISSSAMTESRRRALSLVLAGTLWFTTCLAVYGQGKPEYELPPVNYSTTTPHDAITGLRARFASGQPAFGGRDRDVLKTLLSELRVPLASQLLVFSKTSLQRGGIRPDRPRALYFSETTYVGWVPNGLIEIATIDPALGPVFYSFNPKEALKQPPTIERSTDCLRCHGDTFVRGIPAVFARSVFPDKNGEPLLRFGSLVVDDQTPFTERWGGWYVTGYHGKDNHRGNVVGEETNGQLIFTSSDERPDDLSTYFDASDYLAPTSDVVALMVLEHQMAMQNTLTRAAFSIRKMINYQRSLQLHFKEPVTDEPVYDSVKSVFASTVQDVLDRLLFLDEARIPEGVTGTKAFQDAFAEDAPRSRGGHSLKDLSLSEHLFVNRCSYLIYSESFQSLAEPFKNRVLDRLQAVLRGHDDRYAYLGPDERQRIYDILIDTHPDAMRRWLKPKASPVAMSQ
jgi:hypothetical protein